VNIIVYRCKACMKRVPLVKYWRTELPPEGHVFRCVHCNAEISVKDGEIIEADTQTMEGEKRVRRDSGTSREGHLPETEP
jgi:DNA-directed RNA polymerase subunit RPC12/RpoP